MSLTFEGECLLGETGTVLVDAVVTDASYCHAFGTEYVVDLDWLPVGFVPDSGKELDAQLVEREVSAWIDAHESQIMRQYDRKVKGSHYE